MFTTPSCVNCVKCKDSPRADSNLCVCVMMMFMSAVQQTLPIPIVCNGSASRAAPAAAAHCKNMRKLLITTEIKRETV